MDNQTHTQIENYLAGRLQGAALEQFERALATDPELSAEVDLYRDMATALTPGAEAALRQNLNMLGQQYAPSEATPKNGRYVWMAALAIVALFSGWLIWRAVSKEPAAPLPPATPEIAPPIASQPLPSEQTAPLNQPSPTPVPDVNAGKNKSALIAADFRPNPRLEELYQNQYRSGGFQFQVSQPVPNATLKLKNGQAGFLLSGTVETTANQIKAPFRVLIFSNKPQDYENFSFLFSEFLKFEKQGGQFRFRTEAVLRLKPGLYYYMIEAKDSGMQYHLGKIRVTE